MIWYRAEIDTINYDWDDTNPEVLRLTKYYKRIKFNPTLLSEVKIKINQQQNSKMINNLSDLMRVKTITP